MRQNNLEKARHLKRFCNKFCNTSNLERKEEIVNEIDAVIDSCCQSQYIDFQTHLHGHTLDLLMAPSKFSAISDVKGSGFISDHKIISCVVDFQSSDTPMQKAVTFSILN